MGSTSSEFPSYSLLWIHLELLCSCFHLPMQEMWEAWVQPLGWEDKSFKHWKKKNEGRKTHLPRYWHDTKPQYKCTVVLIQEHVGKYAIGTEQRAQTQPFSHTCVVLDSTFPSNTFSTVLYSTLALRGWPFCIVVTIPLCPIIPRKVWPLRGDIITDPYDHFNRFRICNIMGDKKNKWNTVVFYILGKYNHKLKIF